MQSADPLSDKPAMIPWVIALLLAMVCASTIPDRAFNHAGASEDHIGVSQAADHTTPTDGRVFKPHLVLSPPSETRIWIALAFIREFGRKLDGFPPSDRWMAGTVRGRAPPHAEV